jgi:hypothetical protein
MFLIISFLLSSTPVYLGNQDDLAHGNDTLGPLRRAGVATFGPLSQVW